MVVSIGPAAGISLADIMALPRNIALTIEEARQIAVRVAIRYGVPMDMDLVAEVDDVISEIIIDAAMGRVQRPLSPPRNAWGNAHE